MAYAGQEADTLEPVNVSRLIEKSLELLKVVVSKQAVLQLRLAADVPAVRADVGTIRQILINLATNASEAIGKRDGVIQVSTSRVSLESDSLSRGRRLPPAIIFSLKFPTRVAAFLPRNYPESSILFTTKSKGRGLGLPVTQGIVRRLGGTVNVRSEAGHGTAFQILLPGVEESAPDGRAYRGATGEQRALAGGTILFVEDEETLRLAISKMLRKEGFTIRGAQHAQSSRRRTHHDASGRHSAGGGERQKRH